MRQFVNQHSYVLVALVVIGGAAFIARRIHGGARWIALVAVLAVVIGAALWLRNPGSVGSETDFDRLLAKGKPVALEFYSNF